MQGVAKRDFILQQYPTLTTSHKDVDNAWEAVDYVINNALMSLPYMATTAGATALAPLTAGVSLTAPAALYAGSTWNEMEGENEEKNATWAIGAGIAQAALDRLGLGLILKSGVAPKKILKDAVENLVKGWRN